MSIFRDASQAVHFAYMIDAYPAGPGSQLARVLPGSRSGIDLHGLSAMEVRAECGRIRHAVKGALSGIALDTMEARFSARDQEKLAAAWRVASHLSDALDVSPPLMESLVLRHYGLECQSMRAIAARHEVSKDRILRLVKRIEGALKDIETAAFSMLQERFEGVDLVEAR